MTTNQNEIAILFIGDVVGRPGRHYLQKHLSSLISETGADLTIANGENSAGGLGIDAKCAEELFRAGVDIITSGNHVWNRREFIPYLNGHSDKITRPINYPDGAPGSGFCIIKTKDGSPVLVLNAIGRVFMPDLVDCPFGAIDKLLKEHDAIKIKILDFHAEATSEKIAIGFCFDGRLSAVIGTHTHVQTADERILSSGTAYISDVGMCGPWESVIGVQADTIIKRFKTSLPTRFEVATGDVVCGAVLLKCDKTTGKTNSIKRIHTIG